jgi:hypothetical protein
MACRITLAPSPSGSPPLRRIRKASKSADEIECLLDVCQQLGLIDHGGIGGTGRAVMEPFAVFVDQFDAGQDRLGCRQRISRLSVANLPDEITEPCCPEDARPNPERVQTKAALEELLGDDEDGLAATFEDYRL